MMRLAQPPAVARNRLAGFTLIELMIALLIGIFLLGALLTIVQTNRTVFGDQNKMSILQDGERMAMTMMSDVVQSAGYFPAPVSPNNTSVAGSLPSATLYGATFATGQTISGVDAFNAQGSQISIRYTTASGDQINNCSGQSNTTGGPVTYVNQFEVVPDANGVMQFVCLMNGTQYNLVSNVTAFQVLYGVKANAGAPGNSVDTYMTAAQVNAALLWSNVISVQVQLTFTNPMAASSPKQPPSMLFNRVITVMNQSGPIE